MKLKIATLFAALMLLCSCNKNKGMESFDYSSPEFPAIQQKLSSIEGYIDSVFMQKNYLVELYMKTADGKVFQVLNFDNVPEDLVSIFNIIRYPNSSVPMLIAEFPYNRGEQWENIYSSYYDENGRLMHFTRTSTFFENQDEYSERTDTYFDSNCAEIKQTYHITKNNEELSDASGIDFKYRFKYDIFKNVSEWVDAQNFIIDQDF